MQKLRKMNFSKLFLFALAIFLLIGPHQIFAACIIAVFAATL